jgi:hypothetical protein
MQSRALAQGPAQEAPGVPAGTLRIPPEQLGLGVGGQRGQPEQVSCFDPLQRPIRASGHAAILSRPTPIHPVPQRTVYDRNVPGSAAGETLRAVDEGSLAQAAALLRERNAIDAELARLIQRPMTSGHLGEWIAAQVFDIELEASAVAAGIDGRFRSGPLRGRTVNVKWYLKREGLLDTTEAPALDYYLVLTGPPSAAASSRGTTRPWRIEAAFLFDARRLRAEQTMRGVKRGIASSVIKQQWAAAEIYPSPVNTQLTVTPRQAAQLKLFAL